MDQAFKNFFGGVAKYPSLKKKFYHDNLILPNDHISPQRPEGASPEARLGAYAGAVTR